MRKVLMAAPLIAFISCQSEEPESSSGPEKDLKNKVVQDEPSGPAFDFDDPESLVGHSFEIVEPELKAGEVSYRVVERDGEAFPVTMDHRPDRLNFKIKDGVIAAVTKG